MDFSAWSPSHTLLLVITLLAFGVQLIVILISLKIRTERLEKRQDTTDNRIESIKLEITKQISETRIELRGEIRDVHEELRGEIRDVRTELKTEIQGVRGEIADVRTELSKLNQNHIDHLTRHDS